MTLESVLLAFLLLLLVAAGAYLIYWAVERIGLTGPPRMIAMAAIAVFVILMVLWIFSSVPGIKAPRLG